MKQLFTLTLILLSISSANAQLIQHLDAEVEGSVLKDAAMLVSEWTDQSGAVGLMSHPDIPDHVPTDDEWSVFSDWQLRRLNPPEGLRLEYGKGLPHIRLDTVMRELLGDKFL